MTPNVFLQQEAAKDGITIATSDMHPLTKADVIVIQDLPHHRRELDHIRSSAPNAKLILHLLESPLSRPQNWSKRNHGLFDGVITYDDSLVDGRRYFSYKLPIGFPPDLAGLPGYQSRKPLALINSNRRIGWSGFRNKSAGAAGLPFIGPLFSGWHVDLKSCLQQNKGELYSLRARLAVRASQVTPPIPLDVWGSGWRGEARGWVSRLLPERVYPNARGSFKGDKNQLVSQYRVVLAFENILNSCGYISEKLFDAFYGGAVPAYLGNSQIKDFVPSNCFIDASEFHNEHEMLSYCAMLSQSDWVRYRENIAAFILNGGLTPFLPPAFAKDILHAIRTIASTN